MLGVALVSRARLHAAAGDAEEAGALAREALPILGREGHIGGLIEAIELFGLLASDAGGAAEATRLWAAAATARGTTGYRFRWPVAAGDMDTAVAGARAALGDDEFAGAWRDGERMSLDEARGSATRGHGERPRAASGWEALTAMEEKVAALVAEGLTNRQIGERLFISRHTVDTHLRHVFAKIGVSTRVDLAARAARRMA
jgi:DNA-binding CsgD family transcriptional regulator